MTTELRVDGERFDVENPEPGRYEFSWRSGPNKDYGFTIWSSDGSSVDVPALEQMARGFLAEVDPVTGYIED